LLCALCLGRGLGEDIRFPKNVGEKADIVGNSANVVGEKADMVGNSANVVGEKADIVGKSPNTFLGAYHRVW
jgi:hypothetical protein